MLSGSEVYAGGGSCGQVQRDYQGGWRAVESHRNSFTGTWVVFGNSGCGGGVSLWTHPFRVQGLQHTASTRTVSRLTPPCLIDTGCGLHDVIMTSHVRNGRCVAKRRPKRRRCVQDVSTVKGSDRRVVLCFTGDGREGIQDVAGGFSRQRTRAENRRRRGETQGGLQHQQVSEAAG